jgi:hypothetical protein
MEFLSIVAIMMLTLAGYSTGVVLVRRTRVMAPGLFDLAAVLLLWVAAISTRAELGKWRAIGLWLAIGMVAGGLAKLRARPSSRRARERHSFSATGRFATWKRFAMELGNFQGRMIMVFLYAFLITPFGLVTRASSDRLQLQRPKSKSSWRERDIVGDSIEAARRQF